MRSVQRYPICVMVKMTSINTATFLESRNFDLLPLVPRFREEMVVALDWNISCYWLTSNHKPSQQYNSMTFWRDVLWPSHVGSRPSWRRRRQTAKKEKWKMTISWCYKFFSTFKYYIDSKYIRNLVIKCVMNFSYFSENFVQAINLYLFVMWLFKADDHF